MAKAVQSRLAPVVIGKKDARLTLNNKRSGQQYSSCHGKSAPHSATRQYHSRVFINSSHKESTETIQSLEKSLLVVPGSVAKTLEGKPQVPKGAIVW